MANGVAYLNPKFPKPFNASISLDIDPDVYFVETQHDELAKLVPEPYLYGVDFEHVQTVIDAAQQATTNRFASYVPPAFTMEETKERVAHDVLEDQDHE